MKRKSTKLPTRLSSLILILTVLFGTHAWASATLPAAPSNLTATAVSSSQINLSWSDNATDESYYRIERSANGIDGWYMFSATNANATSYSVTGLTAGTTYYYRVRAEKVRVGVSAPSNTASVTTPLALSITVSSFVAAPSNLTATAVSNSQINLSWSDNSTDESYFRIERSLNGIDNWYMISATNSSTYSNTGLTAGTTYYYRVRAEKVRVGVSAPSNTASATTQATSVVAAPSNLTATAISSGQINLSWSDNSTDESYFRIERSPNGIDWIMLSATNGNTYANTGLTAGTTYYYRVRAEKVRVGFSAYSNTASATTTQTLVTDSSSEASVFTYPNPTFNNVTVQVDTYWQKDAIISLQNAKGETVSTNKISGPAYTFDLSNLPNGMYVIHLLNATTSRTYKIFKQ